jgi:NitT/TauT family transport system permease protein
MSTQSTQTIQRMNATGRSFTPLLGWLAQLRYPAIGITVLLAVWWAGGYVIANDPDMWAFANFAPAPTFSALYDLVASGSIWPTIQSSLYRVLVGLFWGVIIGVPVGVLIGYIGMAMKIANVPLPAGMLRLSS